MSLELSGLFVMLVSSQVSSISMTD